MHQASTIIAVCALFVSLISLATSIYFSWCARDHNRRTVKPLPYILQPNFENKIAVVIRNNGTGPLILEKAQATSLTSGRSGHLIDLIPMPPKGILFRNFNKIEQIRGIRPGDEVDLLDLRIDVNDPVATKYRDELRRALGDMKVELTYTDVYNTHFPKYTLDLDWFR